MMDGRSAAYSSAISILEIFHLPTDGFTKQQNLAFLVIADTRRQGHAASLQCIGLVVLLPYRFYMLILSKELLKMKNSGLGTATLLLMCILSWSVHADSMGSMDMDHGKTDEKQVLQEQCKAIAEQHQVTADRMEAWVKKCMDHAIKAKQDADDKAKNPGSQY